MLSAANTAPSFDPRTATVVVGQRFYQSGYCGSGPGTIVAVHGQQAPSSILNLGGVHCGGTARFDLVYDDGSRANQVPESIVRSLPYTIRPEVVSADEVAQRVAYSECVAEFERRKAAKEKADFEVQVATLRAAPEYAHLEQGRDRAVAARNIRAQLKRAFPGVKFSVRQSRGVDAIDVSWTGGPNAKEVEAIALRYKSGHFDGMTDSYNFSARAWTAVFGDAQYISCDRQA